MIPRTSSQTTTDAQAKGPPEVVEKKSTRRTSVKKA